MPFNLQGSLPGLFPSSRSTIDAGVTTISCFCTQFSFHTSVYSSISVWIIQLSPNAKHEFFLNSIYLLTCWVGHIFWQEGSTCVLGSLVIIPCQWLWVLVFFASECSFCLLTEGLESWVLWIQGLSMLHAFLFNKIWLEPEMWRKLPWFVITVRLLAMPLILSSEACVPFYFKSMFGFSKWVIWLIACPNVFRVSYSGQCVCGQFLGQDCLLGWSLSTSLSFG